MNGFQMNGRVVEPQKQSMLVELLLMRKTQTKLQQKCVSHQKKLCSGKIGTFTGILLFIGFCEKITGASGRTGKK